MTAVVDQACLLIYFFAKCLTDFKDQKDQNKPRIVNIVLLFYLFGLKIAFVSISMCNIE